MHHLWHTGPSADRLALALRVLRRHRCGFWVSDPNNIYANQPGHADDRCGCWMTHRQAELTAWHPPQAAQERFGPGAAVDVLPSAAVNVQLPVAATLREAGLGGASAGGGAGAAVGLTSLNYAPPFELRLTDAVRPQLPHVSQSVQLRSLGQVG